MLNAQAGTESCCLESLCNVIVAPDEVVITADLPNAEHKPVKVEASNDDLIEITAKMKKKTRFDDFGITHREGEFSYLSCQLRVPVPVNTKRIRVSFKGGILKVRLPKKRGYRTRVKRVANPSSTLHDVYVLKPQLPQGSS